MDDRRMARADLVTGVILLALALSIVAGAWTMDRLEVRHIHPSSAPGVTPGLLGIALAIASMLLVWRALASGALVQPRASGGLWGAAPGRLVTALALSLLYALGLLGRAPYWLATALFVASFIAAFEWGEREGRIGRLSWALAIGIAAGFCVSYVFSELFLVRLP
jgi:putative tricarboxylic transport membrane protein